MVVAVHIYFIEEKRIFGSGSLQEKRKENGKKLQTLFRVPEPPPQTVAQWSCRNC